MRMTLDEASKHPLNEIVDQVRTSKEPVILTGSDGDLVKIVLIPKPIEMFLGRPVYKLGDLQHLDFPYVDEHDIEQ